MSKKPRHQRKIVGKPGRLDAWPVNGPCRFKVSGQVRYLGSGKHKNYPSPNNAWVPNLQPGASKCDHFAPGHWQLLEKTLKDAIAAGCVQFAPGESYPSRVWAFVNDILHEARRTNPDQGEYHAFPLLNKSQYPIDRQNLLKGAPRVTIPTI